MQRYKGYFMMANAMPVHPFSPDWYVGGSVLVSGPYTSIVGVTRFQLQQFTVSMKTCRMVRAGGCADSGGRMPASTMELNGELRSNAPVQSVKATWESWRSMGGA